MRSTTPGNIKFRGLSLCNVLFSNLGAFVLIPSMCSYKSSRIGERIGSKMKSIPSRRAFLAAGTKSLSPEIKMILSTCFLKESEEISTPILMSTPFWVTDNEKSFSSNSSIVFLHRIIFFHHQVYVEVSLFLGESAQSECKLALML